MPSAIRGPRACRRCSTARCRTSACSRSGCARPTARCCGAATAFPQDLDCRQAQAAAALPRAASLRIAGGPVHVGVHPVDGETGPIGKLVLVHDMSFIERRSEDTQRTCSSSSPRSARSIALITVVVAQLSWRGWVSGVRALLRGEGLLRPIGRRRAGAGAARRATCGRCCAISRTSTGARTSTQTQLGRRSALRALLRTQLRGDEVHRRLQPRALHPRSAPDGGIVVQRPASGLVTALEPVMRACSGHLDRARQRQRRPRDRRRARPRAACRPGSRLHAAPRLAHAGGGAGLLLRLRQRGPVAAVPHRARAAGVPRLATGSTTATVNQRFADAVVAEARSEDPIVLVQDYHFALLPRDDPRAPAARRPSSRSGTSPGRIPSRSASARGASEILEGMLGSTILGFHTQFHCNNFLETVDRYLEARIEREHSTISFQRRATRWSSAIRSRSSGRAAGRARSGRRSSECRAAVCERLGLPPDSVLAIGVDRFDYTKGILERLHAVERLLEKHPRVDRHASPSCRSPRRRAASLEEYQLVPGAHRARWPSASTSASAAAGYRPSSCWPSTTSTTQVNELYRAADVCFVTSLHDGMNLVAQGVRRGARRRAGRADPQPLRRRGARAARGADRQSRTTSRSAPTRCTAR